MSLCRLTLCEEVFRMCLYHALCTDSEEIMGLLLGHVEPSGDTCVVYVRTIKVLRRVDKRSDRVELTPESLIGASTVAEELTEKHGIPTRVVGWYHSHPRITYLPSAVDLKTQWMYQQMDPSWAGLIVSVFEVDPQKRGKFHFHAFQARVTDPVGASITQPALQRVEIPVHTLPCIPCSPSGDHDPHHSGTIDILKTLLEEAKVARDHALQPPNDALHPTDAYYSYCHAEYLRASLRILNGCIRPLVAELRGSSIPSLQMRKAQLQKELESSEVAEK